MSRHTNDTKDKADNERHKHVKYRLEEKTGTRESRARACNSQIKIDLICFIVVLGIDTSLQTLEGTNIYLHELD